MNLIGKGRKAVEQLLKRSGYNNFLWIEEEMVLECSKNHSGVCIKSCSIRFSSKGRVVSFKEKIW